MLLPQAEADRFRSAVLENPVNAALLSRLPGLGLPDCWLVAGCLFGTYWNVQTGRPPAENIRDYDVLYFDAADTTYEAEDTAIRLVDDAVADLGIPVEVRNQARVHLWYQQRFGRPYPALASTTEGIDRFLVACTCVGIRCVEGEPADVYATHGLADLEAGILRPNLRNHPADRYREKAESYARRWPWLRIT